MYQAKRWSLNLALIGMIAAFAVEALAQVSYEANAPVSTARKKALLIYSRLTGEKTHIDSQIIKDMEVLVAQGRLQEAAQMATDRPEFYNNTLRFFGQALTTAVPSYKAPFSDLVATIMGVAKDNVDARELLTAPYLYRVSNLPNVRTDVADIHRSNNHYADVQAQIEQNSNLDLRPLLVQERQQVLNADNNNNAVLVDHPEPAGILTSRAFSELCASAGTNRRCYEHSMKKFMCTNLEPIADTSSPDMRVGRDVSRAPAGDPSSFQTTCRGCHGNMDAQRGAFAYLEFDNNRIKHGKVFNGGNLFDNNTRVAVKYNRMPPGDGFPNGYTVIDNTFINNMVTGGIGQYFGWRTEGQVASAPIMGAGITAYGRMLAESQAYSNCLVKKTFATVCRREIEPSEVGIVRKIASEFESTAQGNRKLKWLFERVATDESCIGR